MKECHDNEECASGFSCILAKKYGKKICAKYKSEVKENKRKKNLDYTNPSGITRV